MQTNYVSLDIETGGLDFNCSLLQIAMVKWDHEDINQCSSIDLIIKSEGYYCVEPVAAVMNAKLLAILAEGSDPRIHDQDEAYDIIENWLGDKRYFAVGKNAATFDLPFLEYHDFEWKRFFRHRVLDVGSLYATPDGIPALPVILTSLEEAGVRSPVSGDLHDAEYDARVTLWAAQQALAGTAVL